MHNNLCLGGFQVRKQLEIIFCLVYALKINANVVLATVCILFVYSTENRASCLRITNIDFYAKGVFTLCFTHHQMHVSVALRSCISLYGHKQKLSPPKALFT